MKLAGKRKSGSINIQLAIFIGLFIISTFLFYSLYAIDQNYYQEIKINDKKIQDIKSYDTKLLTKLQEIESLTGFYRTDKLSLKRLDDVNVDVNELIRSLNKINNEYKELKILNFDLIKEEELDYANSPASLEKIINAFTKHIYQLEKEIDLLKKNIETAEINISNTKMAKREIEKKLTPILDSLKDKIDDENKRFNSKLSKLEQLYEQNKSDQKLVIGKSNKLAKSIVEEKQKFEKEIKEKTGKIKELQAAKYGRTVYSAILKQKDKHKEFQPANAKIDGEIVFTDPKSQIVYISLGNESNLIPGLKFDVYRKGNKAKKNYIGTIEVQKIMNEVSCAKVIVLENELDPIVRGDLIINPVLNKDMPIYFAFAGNFAKISKEKAAELISKIGGKVENKITSKTRFVVIGSNATQSQNYTAAINFGIPLMTEKVLLRYIGD